MNEQERERRWVLLARLLRPVHGPALATARRLCRTAADGEDLYADTVLHTFDKLHALRARRPARIMKCRRTSKPCAATAVVSCPHSIHSCARRHAGRAVGRIS